MKQRRYSEFATERYPNPSWGPWGQISPDDIARMGIEQSPGSETHFIRSLGGRRRLAVEIMGDPYGYPILLAPGTPGGRIGPKPDSNSLPYGTRLITWDRPGYGFSCRSPGRLAVNSVSDASAIAEYLGIEKFGVVGRSGGAGHALAIAARLDGVESAAAIVPSAPYEPMGDEWFNGMGDNNTKVFRALFKHDTEAFYLRPKSGRPILNLGDLDALGHVASMLGEQRFALFNHSSDTPASNATGIKSQTQKEALAALRFGNWGRIDDLLGQENWGFDLAEITVPTLVWGASHDIFTPTQHAEFIAGRIGSAATLHIEPDADHYAGMDATVRGIRWCKEHAMGQNHKKY